MKTLAKHFSLAVGP